MRSPLFYPLNRGMDAEAGGAADLQTDVMRFMAILSLCLVAIFALVQSIPLAPSVQKPAPVEHAADPPKPEPRNTAQVERAPQPEVLAERQITLTRPQPRKLPVREKPPEKTAMTNEMGRITLTSRPLVVYQTEQARTNRPVPGNSSNLPCKYFEPGSGKVPSPKNL